MITISVSFVAALVIGFIIGVVLSKGRHYDEQNKALFNKDFFQKEISKKNKEIELLYEQIQIIELVNQGDEDNQKVKKYIYTLTNRLHEQEEVILNLRLENSLAAERAYRLGFDSKQNHDVEGMLLNNCRQFVPGSEMGMIAG